MLLVIFLSYYPNENFMNNFVSMKVLNLDLNPDYLLCMGWK